MAGPQQQPSAEEIVLTAFNRMRDELLSTLTLHLGNREDAQDVAQEAFLKCWRNRHEVHQVRNLRAWIYRIALNTARDNRRSGWHKRRRALDDASLDSSICPHGQECEIELREFYAHLRRALLQLRPEEREVFLLRQNAELSYEEIADIRNVPIGTVKTQMRSALAKLREVLRAHAPCAPDYEEP
ncbi:MAG: RNA polymerase sigma factor [Gemmatales bacterium]|nr:RNA polymerase sigma factor [Gemmatales bacterium]MCS7160357.1 RNA polymerase sigma factor [Gemmatales bacterium]MDW8175557.1 RNA polymerase sigma factor [Gemmatales bacterium]MDW8221904.1 RNA polymerase sigma factor [Gemmatales bacterium]